ncbi:uncharacterized protein SOCE26_052720 [Sorangium cellulosum]|uniref:Uncharacterized protein n=1 Tax=Sorangium cellulosum TaxID=56 RepID=A0A2L0EWY7_SORCE|nr:hypothetical protein [Sorangium cellulosum]AUX43817.1 uncharacterized protein SOCE26_052720 [Sorangium cellulosum]
MSNEFEDILHSLGIDTATVAGVLADYDEDDLEGFDEDDVGRVIQKVAPGLLSADQIAKISGVVTAKTDGFATLVSAAAAARMAEQNLRPNAAVTLYATNAGDTCNVGQIYDLRPRKNGQLENANFQFTTDMSFLGLRADQKDINAGFSLVAGSVGFADENANSFRWDIGLQAFKTEISILETPLASLYKRTPKSSVDFRAKVYCDADVAQPFYGLQLIFTDVSCNASRNKWLDNLEELDFAGLTRAIKNTAARKVTVMPKTKTKSAMSTALKSLLRR